VDRAEKPPPNEVDHYVKEKTRRQEGHKGTHRRDVVPTAKRVRVIWDTPGHTRQTQEMHGKEGEVDPYKEGPKVNGT